MSLDQSVDLVMYAFEKALSGDIFVQKASSCTINDLVIALKEIFNSSCKVRIIGTRHGEKLYESLISREEMSRANDLGGYYQIPADVRDLNYAQYFVEGEEDISSHDDYTSHNTKRLDIEEIKIVLKKLDFIKERLSD